MNRGQQISFWDLISNFSIEIPTIQRDYTYGRESAKEISGKIIKAILKSCEDPFDKLHLDFIYGRLEGIENFHLLEKNKQSIESLLRSIQNYADNLHLKIKYETEKKTNLQSEIVTFIPLDGQQRLTTLFLIHWYFAFERKDHDSFNNLKRFTYTTRNSSREFLNLISNPSIIDLKIENRLVDGIMNHEMFFASWKMDPTVNSMLSVLDQIEIIVLNNSINKDLAWKALTEINSVSFDFFDLDDFELTDELYVKMNARGKSLTGFENFKAWLLKNYKEKIGNKDLGKKLDIEWFDLFWKDQEEVENIDDKYLQFFKNLYLSDYLLAKYNDKDTAQEINADKNVELLRNKTEKSLIPLFESNDTFSKNIDRYIMLLDIFANMECDYKFNPSFQSNSLFEYFFKNNQGLNFPNNTYQYALSRYILENGRELTYFKQWARVIGNLIFNTPIETAYLHRNACKSIEALIKTLGSDNLYEKLSQLEGSIDFFDGEQVKEEVLKSKLIIENPEKEWESQLIKLETHYYFYGQIGFILEIAKNDFDHLIVKGEKIRALFSEDVLNQSNYLLFRAFLSKMDSYFKPEINKYYFPKNIRGTLRDRNENWRRFIKVHLGLINTLISLAEFDSESIISSLEIVCKLSKTNDRYIKTILSNPKVLNTANQHHIRKYNQSIFLLSSSRISGYFSELFTIDWFLRHEKSFGVDKPKYRYVKGENNNPGIEFYKNGIIIKFLDFNRSLGKFGINQIHISKTPEEIYLYDSIDDAVSVILNELNQSSSNQ